MTSSRYVHISHAQTASLPGFASQLLHSCSKRSHPTRGEQSRFDLKHTYMYDHAHQPPLRQCNNDVVFPHSSLIFLSSHCLISVYKLSAMPMLPAPRLLDSAHATYHVPKFQQSMCNLTVVLQIYVRLDPRFTASRTLSVGVKFTHVVTDRPSRPLSFFF